ncbi:MAG: ATP-binding cassette domain-containing protein [Candidatus Dormibacteria bacterium]
MATALAIEAEGLDKTYGKSVHALRGVGFAVAEGTVFGLLGPNGAGKSTAVKILTTLSRPDAGWARVGGLDVLRQPKAVRRLIGCVAQKNGVDLEATGRENLTLQGQLYGMGRSELHSRVGELLGRFQLEEAADRVARTYSGGMLSKLGVALGLVHRPRVLFLDEPTTGLDPQARAEMWEEIRRLARRDGVSVLLTTHYLDEADRLADRLAIIDRGRVVAEGAPEQLKSELLGDAIHVDLDPDSSPELARSTLHGLDHQLRDLSQEGQSLHARVDHGASAVPTVLAQLEAAGVRVSAVTVSRPSLDDVYLRHTGRSFQAAHQGDNP